METSFTELRSKIVVNLVDGRKLGHIIDLIFEQHSAKVLGIVVPGCRGIWNFFRSREDIFIPYHSICKIGADTILVELHGSPPNQAHCCSCPCNSASRDNLVGSSSNKNDMKIN